MSRHLLSGHALLDSDGKGTILLVALSSCVVDRIGLSGPAPAKAEVYSPDGTNLGGTRAAEDDATSGLGLRLLPGQAVTVEVYDGTPEAVHQATAWGA